MRITICSSLVFIDEVLRIKHELEALGHEVATPPATVPGRDGNPISVAEMYKIYKQADPNDPWVWNRREISMHDHYQKIEWANVVLIVNVEKSGILGYIGMNTMMEMGLAFYLRKKIYLLNPIPDVSYREEILGMKPLVLNGDLKQLG